MRNPHKPRVLGLILLGFLGLAAGCQTPAEEDEDLHDEDLHLGTDWNELMMDRGVGPAPLSDAVRRAPGGGVPAFAAEPRDETFSRELQEALLTPERLGALPPAIRQNPDLARLAVTRYLSDPRRYDVGVLGSIGRAKVFVAPSAAIKDQGRLYWVQVKLLSEGYSCFISAQRSLGQQTLVHCRDGRQVMFWKSQGPDWISFHARQFDAQGYEIQVRHKRIVRISSERMI